jgi:hypothetical protein
MAADRELALQGKLSEAILQLRDAVRLAPTSAELRNALGASLAQDHSFKEAITELRRAIELPRTLRQETISAADGRRAMYRFRELVRKLLRVFVPGWQGQCGR